MLRGYTKWHSKNWMQIAILQARTLIIQLLQFNIDTLVKLVNPDVAKAIKIIYIVERQKEKTIHMQNYFKVQSLSKRQTQTCGLKLSYNLITCHRKMSTW